MTPNEILTEVKSRFSVLLHDDETDLEALLKQALTKYQDLACVTSKLRMAESDLTTPDSSVTGSYEIALPSDFLARVVVKDKTGSFIQSDAWTDDDVLELQLSGMETYPLILSYLVRLDNVDLDAYELPVTAIGLISDYLQALISIPNAERLRRVSVAGKLDTSDIPTEPDLQARKTELETQMASNKSILPTLSFV